MLDPLNHRTLKAARTATRLTRAELALLSGVDATTIFRIETKKQTPSADTWSKLARVLQALEAA